MSATDVKAMHQRLFEEGMNRANQEVFDELIAPNYVNHSFPAPAPGREGFKQVVAMFRAGFPDFHITLDDVLVEGDKVVSRGTMHGTHRGEFMGIPPTGKTITMPYIDIWRAEGGQFVENWVQMDLLGLMQQLGAGPAPGQAPA